ncbi:agamous-like MADS-box protein AGL62 [Durio zibethinus]|uniref:Agamous-like MADS-box protein AGL62 n=1 Tax=Durio zibethinus TaxID=66656 RepID=A0A6P5X7Z4_DURZI|nr:agamous-like MADS-box protein AGL62 [Durio zibethinus]
MSGSGKKTKGRQKIEMKKIENEEDRLITFSKRRSGIYKKASELATLCGCEVAFMVFSPAGKPFSFGHPSIESVANRFLNQNPPPNDNTHPLVEAHRKIRINQLSQYLNELLSQLDAEKEKAKMLDLLTHGKQTHGWWEAPTDQLNQQELEKQYSNYEELLSNLYGKINEKSAVATSSLVAPTDPAQFTDTFTTIANEEVPASFPPGYNHGGQQF